MKAIWNGTILAESENTVVVERNHYFPRDSIRSEYFRESDTRTNCPWKGNAAYLHIEVGDAKNPDAAWYYPEPRPEAENIRDRVAFWRGVEIV